VPAIEAARSAQWYVVPGLLAVQVLTLLANGVRPAELLRAAGRLKWLFVFLILSYTLLPPADPASGDALYRWQVPGTSWVVPLNLSGLAQAGLMCLQILTLVLASAVVRRTGPGTDLIDGLRAFGLPQLFVHSFDRTLDLLGDLRQPEPDGHRRAPANASAPSPGLFAALSRLPRGDVGALVRSVEMDYDRARAHAGESRLDPRLAHDVAVIAGVALVLASLKMVKLLPGIPFAPGIKTVLFFPLYVLAAHRTQSRWGATATGAVVGVIGFLQGDGRYGVLEILKHLAPGLVIDLAMPLVRRLPPSAFVYCLLGFVAAIAWTSTELVVVLLLGARAEVYLFPAAKLVPNLIAGTLSGFVTAFVLRAFREAEEAARLDGGVVVVESIPVSPTVLADTGGEGRPVRESPGDEQVR
jgi:hypothetical protein